MIISNIIPLRKRKSRRLTLVEVGIAKFAFVYNKRHEGNRLLIKVDFDFTREKGLNIKYSGELTLGLKKVRNVDNR